MVSTNRNIRVEGFEELARKANWDFTIQPEIQGILETAQKRVERQGKGLGARNNSISAQSTPLNMKAVSTLNWPRTKGTSWQRKNIAALKSLLPNAIRKALDGMARRWGS